MTEHGLFGLILLLTCLGLALCLYVVESPPTPTESPVPNDCTMNYTINYRIVSE